VATSERATSQGTMEAVTPVASSTTRVMGFTPSGRLRALTRLLAFSSFPGHRLCQALKSASKSRPRPTPSTGIPASHRPR